MKKPDKGDEPILLSREQVAKLLGVSLNHVINLERRGVFPAVRLGVTVKYRRADILAAIDRLAEEGRRDE